MKLPPKIYINPMECERIYVPAHISFGIIKC